MSLPQVVGRLEVACPDDTAHATHGVSGKDRHVAHTEMMHHHLSKPLLNDQDMLLYPLCWSVSYHILVTVVEKATRVLLHRLNSVDEDSPRAAACQA